MLGDGRIDVSPEPVNTGQIRPKPAKTGHGDPGPFGQTAGIIAFPIKQAEFAYRGIAHLKKRPNPDKSGHGQR